jgi:hypothetical protein
MDDTDQDKREAALLARLEAEREQRLAERIAEGEVVRVPVFVVAGSAAAARAQVEEAKAAELAKLREAGDQREVTFFVELIVTGVRRHDEEPSGPAWKPVPRAPSRTPEASCPNDATSRPPAAAPQLPVIETYIAVQTRACRDDDDAGEVAEGWYSIDGKTVTVTDTRGGYVGSRAMIAGEDPKTVAKGLLREKVPEGEDFNRRLSYPNMGMA